MGMSFFARNRVSRKPVEKFEAERFKEFNEKHWERKASQDRRRGDDEKDQEKSWKKEVAANEAIGEKTREGMEADVTDMPLRIDHTREIAGRNLEDVQSPKDPVARIDERIPETSKGEKLVPHTSVDAKPASKQAIEDARREVTEDKSEEARKAETPKTEAEDAPKNGSAKDEVAEKADAKKAADDKLDKSLPAASPTKAGEAKKP
jgi:hypothetical protein